MQPSPPAAAWRSSRRARAVQQDGVAVAGVARRQDERLAALGKADMADQRFVQHQMVAAS
jgi:hypothetical protein